MINETKAYKVTAKCGHVRKGNYIPIDFPVLAETGKQASAICRNFPRVKHHHKDAIISCKKITEDEYNELKIKNNNDPYLKCHSKQEQNTICDLSNRLCKEEYSPTSISKIDRKDIINYKQRKYKLIIKDMQKTFNDYEFV